MKQNLSIIYLALAVVAGTAASDPGGRHPDSSGPGRSRSALEDGCWVKRQGARVELCSPAFVFALDTADGLRGQTWRNRLTGREISLGYGPEVELEFDAAEQRIWITGWKQEGDRRTTHVFLPRETEGKPLTLTLGGLGMYDYREIEASINGQKVGVRQAPKRWNELGIFNLGPESDIYPHLRFGQDNILVVRCREQRLRTERMDQVGVDMNIVIRSQWPAQFEQYLTVGTPLASPQLRVKRVQDRSKVGQGEARVELESSDKSVGVVVTYRWNAKETVLRKFVEIQNQSKTERRLMNVRLGDYMTDVAVSDGEQGFPVYLGSEFFMSLAHPSGWAEGQDGRVTLRQYPGQFLKPGGRLDCMEVVLGNAERGKARQLFLDHIRNRSRRVVRGHDKPYAIYDTFGANVQNGKQVEDDLSFPDAELNEPYILEMLEKVGLGQKEAGYQFDLCNTHFWVDYEGDLERFDPKRFPNGFTKIKAKLDELHILPGLWIDSSWEPWTISKNPLVQPTFTHDPAYDRGLYKRVSVCRATDPIRTMYSTAFSHHIRENDVRLIKCDNLQAICYNPNHPHLPGVYSTEAIQSAVIQTLRDWDAVNPEVLLMLYWGYRSPWWLLHGDTIFESGLQMEAASPGPSPTLYVRDGVTLRMDQGQLWSEDVPALGKDSLGIWLSNWSWNSHIGKERWQEGFVMDLCRGSMLAQIWTDYEWLTPPERKQLAEFIALLKARPQCFANPRLILGDVWKGEPYGYSCSDGKRTFLALNNCTWADVTLPLELNGKWGLTDGGRWEVYRWYPEPAKLEEQGKAFGATAAISLRPFEVVLLEVVSAGQSPALTREFPVRPLLRGFAEASGPVALTVAVDSGERATQLASSWQTLEPVTAAVTNQAVLTGQSPACPNGGTLVITTTLSLEDKPFKFGDAQVRFTCRGILAGEQIPCEPVVRGPHHPASWQAWRIKLNPSAVPQPFEFRVAFQAPTAAKFNFQGHYIPAEHP